MTRPFSVQVQVGCPNELSVQNKSGFESVFGYRILDFYLPIFYTTPPGVPSLQVPKGTRRSSEITVKQKYRQTFSAFYPGSIGYYSSSEYSGSEIFSG
jgi:hypothetical protein